MDISNLWTLQVMMFFLVAAGAVLKSTGILKDDAKGILILSGWNLIWIF